MVSRSSTIDHHPIVSTMCVAPEEGNMESGMITNPLILLN
jgi:hypothetical protein